MSKRKSPLGLVLGVAAAALLTHARAGRADCAWTPEVLTLELEGVTLDGQAVSGRAAWQRSHLEVASSYPGQAYLSVSTDAGAAVQAMMSPGP